MHLVQPITQAATAYYTLEPFLYVNLSFFCPTTRSYNTSIYWLRMQRVASDWQNGANKSHLLIFDEGWGLRFLPR